MSAAAGAPRASSALPWIGGTAAGLVAWMLGRSDIARLIWIAGTLPILIALYIEKC